MRRTWGLFKKIPGPTPKESGLIGVGVSLGTDVLQKLLTCCAYAARAEDHCSRLTQKKKKNYVFKRITLRKLGTGLRAESTDVDQMSSAVEEPGSPGLAKPALADHSHLPGLTRVNAIFKNNCRILGYGYIHKAARQEKE